VSFHARLIGSNFGIARRQEVQSEMRRIWFPPGVVVLGIVADDDYPPAPAHAALLELD
jgi:hypothetical protein